METSTLAGDEPCRDGEVAGGNARATGVAVIESAGGMALALDEGMRAICCRLCSVRWPYFKVTTRKRLGAGVASVSANLRFFEGLDTFEFEETWREGSGVGVPATD